MKKLRLEYENRPTLTKYSVTLEKVQGIVLTFQERKKCIRIMDQPVRLGLLLANVLLIDGNVKIQRSDN